MLVRIRYARPQAVRVRECSEVWTLDRYALLLAALLTPSALLAFTMAFWILAAELRWTNEFFLSSGVLSHWQVWLATSGVMLFCSKLLNRFARTVPRASAP